MKINPGISGFYLIITVLLLSANLLYADDKSSVYNKKLASAEKLLQDEKTRKQGVKQLESLAKYAKKKKHDEKFRAGCKALAVLARIFRNACGYEFTPDGKLQGSGKSLNKDSKKKSQKSFEKNLSPFSEYSIVGDWEYDKASPAFYSNPQLAVFIELAYYKALDNEKNENLKHALKMLTYAESRTEHRRQLKNLTFY